MAIEGCGRCTRFAGNRAARRSVAARLGCLTHLQPIRPSRRSHGATWARRPLAPPESQQSRFQRLVPGRSEIGIRQFLAKSPAGPANLVNCAVQFPGIPSLPRISQSSRDDPQPRYPQLRLAGEYGGDRLFDVWQLAWEAADARRWGRRRGQPVGQHSIAPIAGTRSPQTGRRPPPHRSLAAQELSYRSRGNGHAVSPLSGTVPRDHQSP